MQPETAAGRDARTVRELLARVTRRLRLERTLRSVLLGPFAIVVAPNWLRRAPREAASEIERRDGRFKNVLVTADEILSGGLRAPDYMSARVLRDAARLGDAVDVSAALPLRSAVLAAIAGLAGWLTLLGLLIWIPRSAPVDSRSPAGAGSATAPASWHVSATVTPPSYTGLGAETLRDPDRIEALEGSSLSLQVAAGAPGLRVRTPSGVRTLRMMDGGAQATSFVLAESGFITLESETATRLIAVTVVPDQAPNVQITAPGRDLLLPDAKRRIAVAGAADDDLGLGGLEMRYTTISGSGEQFKFREGSVPVALTRESPRRWRAAGEIDLPSLGLEPGDSVIYRLVATDGRGRAGMGSSDTYMIDIAAPGQATLAGFALPPDRDRSALSQQMVLLKIERLHAKRAALALEPLREEALGIAAEQRTVRATFIFMMGGEVEDEEEEAAHSHEIEEGRLENAARRDMLEAVRHMSQVEVQLTAANTAGALPPARAAVAALERAFGRRRYFLRTLPIRSRIDPSRRLSGDLSEARDASRTLPTARESPQSRAARDAVAELVSLAASMSTSSSVQNDGAARRLGRAAERVLALDPSAADLQAASLRLARRASAISAGGAVSTAGEDVRAALETVLARAARFAPRPQEPTPDSGSLEGRWLAAIAARR